MIMTLLVSDVGHHDRMEKADHGLPSMSEDKRMSPSGTGTSWVHEDHECSGCCCAHHRRQRLRIVQAQPGKRSRVYDREDRRAAYPDERRLTAHASVTSRPGEGIPQAASGVLKRPRLSASSSFTPQQRPDRSPLEANIENDAAATGSVTMMTDVASVGAAAALPVTVPVAARVATEGVMLMQPVREEIAARPATHNRCEPLDDDEADALKALEQATKRLHAIRSAGAAKQAEL